MIVFLEVWSFICAFVYGMCDVGCANVISYTQYFLSES